MTQLTKFTSLSTLLILPLFFTSCDVAVDISELTEGDVAEMIESALQSQVGGLTTNIEDLVDQLVAAVKSGEICDSLYSKTIENDYQGTQMQASYASDLNFEMTCTGFGIPETATFSSQTISSYQTPRIQSDDEAEFQGAITGLKPAQSSFLLQGNYHKTGTQEIDFSSPRSVNSAFTTDLTNIEINKQSYAIVAGKGTFTYSGTAQDSDFSYSGTINFNGNGTAALVINGNSYEIDWN